MSLIERTLPTRFCLVRHGETDWNIERRLQGQIDIPLNKVGQQQAEQLSHALSPTDYHFAALYVSDLLRARQTSDAISRRTGLVPIITENLRERHFGLFQGLTYAEAEINIPEAYHQFKARNPAYKPDGGESLATFQHRIHRFFDEAAARHLGQSVLVISHGGVLDIAYRRAQNLPLTLQRNFPIPNAALNWINHLDGQWQLEHWADDKHLAHSRDEV